MLFKEFLLAAEPWLIEYISEFSLNASLSETVHIELFQKQREHIYTSGMPEALLVSIESGSMMDVFEVHRSIAGTYQDDFSKYARQKELSF